jgi:chromate transporter
MSMPTWDPDDREQEDDTSMFARIEAEERAKYTARGLQPAVEADEIIGDDEVTTTPQTAQRATYGGGGGGSDDSAQVSLEVVAKRFLLLGSIAFGGPPAHVALMQVQTWRPEVLDDAAFASLFALTQALPGPSSTQLAVALGVLMGGLYGGLVAFACFSLVATTSMAILGCIAHASAEASLGPAMDATLKAIDMGLGAAAVSLVIKAALDLSTKLASEPMTRCLNVFAAAATLLAPGTSWVLPTSLFIAGCVSASKARYKAVWLRVGLLDPTMSEQDDRDPPQAPSAAVRDQPVTNKLAAMCFMAWGALLVLLMLWQALGPPWWIDLLERFYRVGSLVWGGGPVVLPLLLREVVPRFVTDAQFLQGFAFVQAMPGPMFNFAAYLGGAYAGPIGAIIAWVGLFLPGLLLIYAALPFWAAATTNPGAQAFLKGVNAAASGLVVAAALLMLDVVRTPPQRTIALVCFTIHHWPGKDYFGPKYNAPATVAIGAVLGLPLCLPYVLAHPNP